MMPLYDRITAPALDGLGLYKTETVYRATRVEGQFAVLTLSGTKVCDNGGWIIIDKHGYPDLIDDLEFARLYSPV